MYQIVIWYNPNRKTYYYRKYIYRSFEIGDKNSYDHEVILIIDLMMFYEKVSFKKRVITKIISFLQNRIK